MMTLVEAANFISAQMANTLSQRILPLDLQYQKLLEPLAGRSLLIRLDDLNSGYYLLFGEDSIAVKSLQSKAVAQPDATIHGPLSAFIKATSSTDFDDLTLSGELQFSGSIQLARHFERLLKQLEPDWEEPVAQIFGDVVGHQICTAGKGLLNWLAQIVDSARADVSEYLQHELAVTPPAAEQHDYFDQISGVRSRTDRLLARVQRLKSTLESMADQTPLKAEHPDAANP